MALIPLSIGSFAIGYSVSGMFLSPISGIVRSMNMLDANGRKHKLTYSSRAKDEIAQLVNSYNQMVERIDSAFNTQKQFIQDASHEIKTPLAIIQTNLDTLLADGTATKNELLKGIENSLIGVDALNHLIEQLLNLSLVENKKVENFDILELIKAELESIDKTDYSNHIELSYNSKVNAPLLVTANKFGISRVIANLIDNAYKYSSEAKKPKVSIVVRKQKNKNYNYVLEIINNGATIPQSDLENIFERFYRVDKARSRGTGSFGLGLAIVKKVINENSWHIKASSNKDLTRFSVFFK